MREHALLCFAPSLENFRGAASAPLKTLPGPLAYARGCSEYKQRFASW
jgi:hypothetical protein